MYVCMYIERESVGAALVLLLAMMQTGEGHC